MIYGTAANATIAYPIRWAAGCVDTSFVRKNAAPPPAADARTTVIARGTCAETRFAGITANV